MKLKLDENLGRRSQETLKTAGHDVSTVAEQSLQGSADRDLIERCRVEERCLVTLDLDFATLSSEQLRGDRSSASPGEALRR